MIHVFKGIRCASGGGTEVVSVHVCGKDIKDPTCQGVNSCRNEEKRTPKVEAHIMVKFPWCIGETTKMMQTYLLRLCDAEELERKPQNPALSANESSSSSEDPRILRKLQS